MAFTPRTLTPSSAVSLGQRLRVISTPRLSFDSSVAAQAALDRSTTAYHPSETFRWQNGGVAIIAPDTPAIVVGRGTHTPGTLDVLLIWRDSEKKLVVGKACGCPVDLFRTAHPAGRLPGEAKPGSSTGAAPAPKVEVVEVDAHTEAKAEAKAPAKAPKAGSKRTIADALAAALAALQAEEAEAKAPAEAVDLAPITARVEDLSRQVSVVREDTRAYRLTMGSAVDSLRTAVDRQFSTLHGTMDSAIEAKIAPVLAALSIAPPPVRARVAVAMGSAANPLVSKLQRFGYTPGGECPANVLLAAPPSLGKTFAVRELGKMYDLFLEHGCSDDLDEVPTLLGSATPDGAGGFIVADGVMAEAVRTAASGRTVLVLLDEVLRLSERAQEWLLSFLTGVKTDAGRVYRLRTRRVQDGRLEVLECPTTHLHLVAATNLGPRTPVDAFWSRWEIVRLAFDPALIKATAQSIAASYGMAERECAALGERFANAMIASRKAVSEGTLKFSLDLRDLERGVQLATTGTAAPTSVEVCRWIGDRVADKCAHWSVDLGETDHTISGAAIGAVRGALGLTSR